MCYIKFMKYKKLKLLHLNAFILLLLLSYSCSNDDDSSIAPIGAIIEAPNFVAYNTGMTPIFPEGIEFDTEREAFVFSSASGAGISLVDFDGRVSNLVEPIVLGGNRQN